MPKYLVVGLGTTGLSIANYLAEQKQPFSVIDTRDQPPNLAQFRLEFPEVQVHTGGFNSNLIEESDYIVLSPGVPVSTPEIKQASDQGKKIIGDIELFAQAVKAPVIAITGTNAKSTVTTLVGEMAKAANYQVEVGGNLGKPALALLENKDANLYVLELSSFQLETTYSLQSTVAALLNITPDHMDRYDHFADYCATKHRVFQHASIAVTNGDDDLTACKNSQVKTQFSFTLRPPQQHQFGITYKNNQAFLAYEQTLLIPVSDMPLKGRHAHANALAALAIGYAAGFPLTGMCEVLKTFTGLPHRCQLVRTRAGVRWFNDSKGTNVGATIAAIQGLGGDMDGRLILIAGGVGKQADFSPLSPVISQYVREVVLIGEAAQDIAQIVAKPIKVSYATTMQEAVEMAAEAAHTEDSVLLSPACASFDMFKNFEHRGQVFTEIVKQLK